MDTINLAIARNLKALRKEKKLSMDEVSALSGVSKSMIGQIERGEVNPTISTIWKLANGLRVSPTELILLPQSDMELVDTSRVEPMLESGGRYRNYPLFPFDSARRFEMYYLELEAGVFMQAQAHPAGVQEFISVFSGKLMLTVNATDSLIGNGCAIRFKADVPHAYRNVSDDLCRLSMVIHYPA